MTILLHAWPEAMTADIAAAYVSIDKRKLPPPSFRIGKAPRWRRAELDKWLDTLQGKADERNPWLAT